MTDFQTNDLGQSECPVQPIIVLDFDGTLIRENILTHWVIFLLLDRELGTARKVQFFFSSICRGIFSFVLSCFPATAEHAVKLAFSAFRGIRSNTIEKMISHPAPYLLRRMGQIRYGNPPDAKAVHLNTRLLPLLRQIMAQSDTCPEIRIYSQGSFPLAIRSFLFREDVVTEFRKLGIDPEMIILDVNEPEIEKAGYFTGCLQGNIRTKYSRIYHLDENCIFIGDDADERVIRKSGLSHLYFMNWKKWEKSERNPPV